MGEMQEPEEATSVIADSWASQSCTLAGLGEALDPQSGMLGMGGGGGGGELEEQAVAEFDYQWAWESIGGLGNSYGQMRYEAE